MPHREVRTQTFEKELQQPLLLDSVEGYRVAGRPLFLLYQKSSARF